MKIQTNKYTFVIIVILLTIAIFALTYFLLGKIWEKRTDPNSGSSTSSSSSNITNISSTTSSPQLSYDVQNDKYYSDVVKLGEELKNLALTGQSEVINPNNRNLIYSLNDETFFEDFVKLERQRIDKVYETKVYRINIPTFCSDYKDTPERLMTEFKNAIDGLYAPNTKKINIDGLYGYDIYDSNNSPAVVVSYILVRNGKARFIDIGKWATKQVDNYAKVTWLGLFLSCDVD